MNRKTFCNKFSKFLTDLYSENGKFTTQTSVSDTLNFYVIKIDTENKNKIDSSNLVELFWNYDKESFGETEYSKYSTINLIKTNQKNIMKNVKYTITLDTSNNNHVESTDTGVVTSDFLIGVSDEKYKNLYEKLKTITQLVSPFFKTSKIEYSIENYELVSIETDSYYPSEKLLSIILDNFDLSSEINTENLFLNVI
jgi:hypothetical protein